MKYTKIEIEEYLKGVKEEIRKDNYRIEINNRREDNKNLFYDYVITEEKAKQILLDISVEDFSEVLHNEHTKYKHELLYVFGKDVNLLRRFGNGYKTVSLYIKINKVSSGYVFIVSFHEQKYPIKYYFLES